MDLKRGGLVNTEDIVIDTKKCVESRIKSFMEQMGKPFAQNVTSYFRLSRDNEDIGSNKAESNSISSKRDMIRSFIKKQDNMEIYEIYVDCVVVKDLSRLGRDYIEAGRLIQKTFPAFSVRLIARNDLFDSLTALSIQKWIM